MSEVNHGHWIKKIEGGRFFFHYVCSECGDKEEIARKYCPECGAKMDEETKQWEKLNPYLS